MRLFLHKIKPAGFLPGTPKSFRKRFALGYTLAEVLLVTAVMALIMAVSVPVALPFVLKNDLDIAAEMAGQALRRAQILAMSMADDSEWGTGFDSSGIIVFKGASFVGRDTAFDEVFSVAPSVSFSPPTEVLFYKLTGKPQAAQTRTLSNSASQIRQVIINSEGLIYVQ